MKLLILFPFLRFPKQIKVAYQTLISALLFVGFTASAQGESIELMANKPTVVPLEATTKEYWVGKLSVDRKINIQLLDGKNQLIRQFPARVGNQDLHIQPSGQGEYLLLLSETPVVVELNWKKHQLTNISQVDLEEPLLKPILDTAAKDENWQSLWQTLKQQGVPLVTDLGRNQHRVTFIYQGAKHNVRLLGGPSYEHEYLHPIAGTDLWYRSFTLPSTSLLSYKLAPDVPEFVGDARSRRVAILTTAQRDPLNPNVFPEGETDPYQQNSVLILPNAPAQPGSDKPVIASGSLSGFELDSKLLGNKRRIDIYQTSNFTPAAKEKWQLIAFDGLQYQTLINTPAIVEYLSAKGLIPPVQLVLIDAIDNDVRAEELPDNPVFAQMLIQELLPEIERRTGVSFSSQHRILTGSSYGGLASLQLAWRHSEVFGKVIANSPSLWWDNGRQAVKEEHYLVSERFLQSKPLPVDIYISAGLFETAHSSQGSKGILDGSRNLRDVLRAKGYSIVYREYAAGHEYVAWRGALADGLLALSKID